MIVYQQTKSEFLALADESDLGDAIHERYRIATGRRAPPSEVQSWRVSLEMMAKVMRDPDIPGEAGVGIEFHVPQMLKRIDFLISGTDAADRDSLIIVELKQWDRVKRTDKDGIVVTALGGSLHEREHPSRQAWSYASLLESFSEPVTARGIALKPCAYLHNCGDGGGLNHEFYSEYLELAPLFLKGTGEQRKLRNFIKRYVVRGDRGRIVFEIEHGRVRPSKSLVDGFIGLMRGKQEFVLIDEQKLAFEAARGLWRKPVPASGRGTKRVLIVEGGPGTGKSVIAIQLLADLLKAGKVGKYVSKNAAPRTVLQDALARNRRGRREDRLPAIRNLFTGSGSFVDCGDDDFDALLVDEAHRLNAKSGMYANKGVNQVAEIVKAAKVSIFFVDERQRVTLSDIGTKDEIRRWAEKHHAVVEEIKLAGQFRCGGSSRYIGWLDSVLEMPLREALAIEVRDLGTEPYPARPGAPTISEFDVRVVDSPSELRELIRTQNSERNRARIVAGYCWRWNSRRDPDAADVVIGDFKMQWNLAQDGSLWIIAPESVEQVGCIHTCQGLELDYVGVIVGPDFLVRDGLVITHPKARDRYDRTMRGLGVLERTDPAVASRLADEVIKNTYWTLMTRGMKGCYIHSTDSETNEYFRSRLVGLFG